MSTMSTGLTSSTPPLLTGKRKESRSLSVLTSLRHPSVLPTPSSPIHPPSPNTIPLSPLPPFHRSYTRQPSQSLLDTDQNRMNDQLRKARKSKKRTTFDARLAKSILYQTSFWLFILILLVLLVGSAWGLGTQAWTTGGERRWNIVILTAAYVVLGIVCIIHIWSRLLTVKKILRTMPKPYIPTKQFDLPKKLADHIMIEYSRTAVIAHISQATKGEQEGWGRPGTKWENQHFRTYIISTLPTMKQAMCPDATAPPLSLEPLFDAADAIQDNGAIRLFINSYAKMIEKARYARREPEEVDAAAVEKVVEVVLLTLEMKRRRERGEG
ncbi:hypothetical protein BCR39DRAFT_541490 [Naematelia encephala]|uniref:Defect at low temperature protein 1 n=1 Tax=Naematelia encephala TaxID=71784 RepID=A0A1Y2AV46_9TREE|nr:hypothetical protein BCR39DRAFT_541490 [Naematelia encephala]